jgi:hypothetical protein
MVPDNIVVTVCDFPQRNVPLASVDFLAGFTQSSILTTTMKAVEKLHRNVFVRMLSDSVNDVTIELMYAVPSRVLTMMFFATSQITLAQLSWLTDPEKAFDSLQTSRTLAITWSVLIRSTLMSDFIEECVGRGYQ